MKNSEYCVGYLVRFTPDCRNCIIEGNPDCKHYCQGRIELKESQTIESRISEILREINGRNNM